MSLRARERAGTRAHVCALKRPCAPATGHTPCSEANCRALARIAAPRRRMLRRGPMLGPAFPSPLLLQSMIPHGRGRSASSTERSAAGRRGHPFRVRKPTHGQISCPAGNAEPSQGSRRLLGSAGSLRPRCLGAGRWASVQ